MSEATSNSHSPSVSQVSGSATGTRSGTPDGVSGAQTGPKLKKKPKSAGKKNANKPKTKNNKEDTKDPTRASKFLQLSKLVKKFKPVTINGAPTKAIIEQIKQKEVENADYFDSQYKNSKRLSFIQKYLLEYTKNQPDAVIYLSFIIRPSDPEFPFDLETLKLNLSIPPNYPIVKTQRPSIVVLNDDIPRGFAVNIELGYRRIVDMALNKVGDEEIELVDGTGLLSQVLTLDRYLELFLKQEKRETIKFVKNKATVQKKTEKPQAKAPETPKAPKAKPEASPTTTDVSAATAELRARLLEEMNNKLGTSIKLFKKSAHEHRYKVTLPVYDKQSPGLWRKNNSVDIMLSVPYNYPESNMAVTVPNNFNTNLILKYNGRDGDQQEMLETARYYKQVEKNLSANVGRWPAETPSLVQRLNWLVNNLASFCQGDGDFQRWVESAKSIQVTESA